MDSVYSVAIRLKVLDGLSPVLGLLSGRFKAGAADISKYQERLGLLGKSMGALGVAAAGFAGLSMLKGPIEEATRYQTVLAKITALNLGAGVTAHADQFARSANIIGNSSTQMAEQYADALAIFKSTREADFVTPLMAKLSFANKALYGEAGAGRTSAMYGLLKSIEYRGGTKSEADFAAQADAATKIINASGGRVNGGQLLQAMQTGGILAKTMSNRAFYLDSEPLIQEMGGFRFGTGLNALYANLGQGRGSIMSQQELLRLGLLDRTRVQFNNQGRLKRALPGAFMGMDAMNSDGVEGLLDKVLLPAFARAGITSDKDILSELGMIASNSRGANLLATAFQQRQKLAVQIAANAKALGLDDTVSAAGKTAEGQYADLLAKESTLKTQIGTVILPVYIKALETVRDVLSGIITFAQQNQGLFKGLIGGFAALSGAMAIGGSVRLATLAMEAVGGGFGALTGLLTGPLGLIVALGLAAGAVSGLIAAAGPPRKRGGPEPDSQKENKDDVEGYYWARGWHKAPIRWVQDTIGRAGNTGHWVGYGSHVRNSMHGPHGETINDHYRVIPPPQPHKQQVADVYIDGKKAGKILTRYITEEQATSMGRPRTGGTSPNGSMSRFPVNLSVA